MSRSVQVTEPKWCDFCKQEGKETVLASYDGATTLGPWANMCSAHYKKHGVGLGTGLGQKLVYMEAAIEQQIRALALNTLDNCLVALHPACKRADWESVKTLSDCIQQAAEILIRHPAEKES